jgi:hypothetical protein
MELAFMHFYALVFILIVLPATGRGQYLMLPGNSSGILDSSWMDPVHLAENPAAASGIASLQCGLFAARFKDVKGLSFLSLAVAVPLGKLVSGIVLQHTGSYGYQQNDIDLVLSKNLGALSVGIIFHSRFISVQSIGGYHSMDVGVGFAKTSGQLSFGASVIGIGLAKEQGPGIQTQVVKVGSQCLFKVSSVVSIGILGSKRTGQLVSIQPAIFYRARIINFSMGDDTLRSNVFLLTGWVFKACEVRMLLGYQANLGLINGTELLYKRAR